MTIKHIFYSCVLIFCSCASASADTSNDLYQLLDQTLANSEKYVQQHELRISRVRNLLAACHSDASRYDLCQRLYEEYQAYKNDSALVYLDRCVSLAQKMRNPQLMADAMTFKALQYSKAGMYFESYMTLRKINRKSLDKKALGDYYIANNHLYGEIASYSHEPQEKARCYHISDLYRDSIFQVFPHNSEIYLMKKEAWLNSLKHFATALTYNDRRMARVKPGTHDYAIVAYYRSCIYKDMNKPNSAHYWITQSAISDVQSAIMDQASLWTLAEILAKEGDLKRSHRYIDYSWNFAATFSTRVRSWQISPLLNFIDKKYQKEESEKRLQLQLFFGVVSLLALILVGLLVFVNKQNHRLLDARNTLKETNKKLEDLNMKLSDMNKALDENNQNLSDVNLKLNEINRLKEAYIGHFIGICSLYIDKMDNLRSNINKLVLNQRYKELAMLVKSADMVNQEIDELYVRFDEVFCDLFPHFVSDLNALLRPECRIELSRPQRLTTPLRVFALIRLGIDDSSQIADFLHYSINTIYNYRAKVKNGAIGDRDDFERKVKNLGSIAPKTTSTE